MHYEKVNSLAATGYLCGHLKEEKSSSLVYGGNQIIKDDNVNYYPAFERARTDGPCPFQIYTAALELFQNVINDPSPVESV